MDHDYVVGGTSPNGANVLVVGENATARLQVSLALAVAGFVVSAEADPASAVEMANRHRPALTVVVLPCPGHASGLLRALASGQSHHLVVIVTPSRAASDVIAALRSGARGYLSDTIGPAGLSRALRCVLAGEIVLPRQLVTVVIEDMRRNFGNGTGTTLSPLTMRELQVLALRREGLSNQEIAQRMCIAPVTVRSHVSAIRRKLNAAGRRPLRAKVELNRRRFGCTVPAVRSSLAGSGTWLPGVDVSPRPIGPLAPT